MDLEQAELSKIDYIEKLMAAARTDTQAVRIEAGAATVQFIKEAWEHHCFMLITIEKLRQQLTALRGIVAKDLKEGPTRCQNT